MFASDSDALAFAVSQLAHITPRVYEVKYRDIIYREVVPTSSEAGAGATSIETYFTDGRAVGDFLAAGGDDIPMANVEQGRLDQPIFDAGIGFDWTVGEAERAAEVGKSLPDMKMKQARRGFEEHAQRIGLLGDSGRGLEGYLNGSEVPSSVAGSTLAALVAADPITAADFINAEMSRVLEDTSGVEIPDSIHLPIDSWALLARTRLNEFNDKSILSYLTENNVYTAKTKRPIRIMALDELATAGAGATSRMMITSTNPDVATFHLPLPLRFFPPQLRNLKIIVPGHYRISGVEWRYPLAARYTDGI